MPLESIIWNGKALTAIVERDGRRVTCFIERDAIHMLPMYNERSSGRLNDIRSTSSMSQAYACQQTRWCD